MRKTREMLFVDWPVYPRLGALCGHRHGYAPVLSMIASRIGPPINRHGSGRPSRPLGAPLEPERPQGRQQGFPAARAITRGPPGKESRRSLTRGRAPTGAAARSSWIA
jgi:hypothetical protein